MKLEPRQEKLYEAVSDIDQKYIDEALALKPRKRGYTVPKRLAAIAATLALLLTPWGKIFTPATNPTDGSTPQVGSNQTQYSGSLFAITVSASETEEVEMDANVGATAYSSVAAEEDIQLEEDQPAFIYNQETGEIETYQISSMKSNFYISIWPNEHIPEFNNVYYRITYNGKTIKTADEQIQLHPFAFNPGTDVTGFSFSGWVTEPTDITASIYNFETDELIQEMTFRVTPSISSADNTSEAAVSIEGYLVEMIDLKQY